MFLPHMYMSHLSTKPQAGFKKSLIIIRQVETPGLLATDIHIQIQIILTMIISGDYFW